MTLDPVTVALSLGYVPIILFAALGWFLFYAEWRAHRRFSAQVVSLIKSLGLTLDTTARAWVNRIP
jgi:hypothetical protein